MTLIGILIVIISIFVILILTKTSNKVKYLSDQKSFSTTKGGNLITKALLNYSSNFSIDFYFKTSESDVVLMSLNSDPIIVVKLTEGFLTLGILPTITTGPTKIIFNSNEFTRSTFILNDNDWRYTKLSYNESINRLLCKVDNNPLLSVPFGKKSWNKIRISFGKINDPNYISNTFKGCFHDLGYKDGLQYIRLTNKDMISTYNFQTC